MTPNHNFKKDNRVFGVDNERYGTVREISEHSVLVEWDGNTDRLWVFHEDLRMSRFTRADITGKTFATEDRVKTPAVDANGTPYTGTVEAVLPSHGLVDVRLDFNGHINRYGSETLTLLYSPSAKVKAPAHPMQNILDLIDAERARHIKIIEDAQISLGDLKKAKKIIAEAGR